MSKVLVDSEGPLAISVIGVISLHLIAHHWQMKSMFIFSKFSNKYYESYLQPLVQLVIVFPWNVPGFCVGQSTNGNPAYASTRLDCFIEVALLLLHV